MRKRIAILSVIMFALFLSNVHAATYSTSATESSQGFTVTARANWEYTTGKYASKGPHTLDSRPSNTPLVIHKINYILTHVDNDYKVTQYFKPNYYNPLMDTTSYGSNFDIVVNSAGPY